MIVRGPELSKSRVVECDVVVIGTGAGGGMAMRRLAEAGANVVAIEEGPLLDASDMTQLEDDMLPKLYQERGARMTEDFSVRVLGGRCVGGSTVHNINLCKRLAPEVLRHWAEDFAVSGLGEPELRPSFERVEHELDVSAIPPGDRNRNNRLLQRGVEALGWRGGALSHNRVGCQKSGFCALGCPFAAKQSSEKVLVPAALARGATLYTETSALRILHDGSRALGVLAAALDERGRPRHEVRINAPVVVLAASAIGSATLAHRSALPDPHAQLGQRLHLHPGAAVVGVFADPVDGDRGIPQSYECTEWLDLAPGSDKRVWVTTAFAHPIGAAVTLPGFGRRHREWMKRYRHIAVLSAMVHDETVGQVSARRDGRPRIRYAMSEADSAQLALGLRAGARILFAAGAKSVLIPSVPPIEISDPAAVDGDRAVETIPDQVGLPHHIALTAAHPMSTLPLGDDPTRSVVQSTGEHHQLSGLFVLDGSVFPTSIGGPPQIPIYTLSHHLSAHVIERAKRS